MEARSRSATPDYLCTWYCGKTVKIYIIMAAAKKPKFQSDKYRDRFMDTFSEITSYIKKDVTTEDVGDAMKHLLEVRHSTLI